MSILDDGRLRTWLAARDPGDAPGTLRAAVARVSYDIDQPMLPALDTAISRVFGTARWIRPALALLMALALVVAAVGAARLQPWRAFPPRGLIAFTGPLGPIGTSGISLVAADGSSVRRVTPLQANLYDHAPHWSRDGQTLLFARTSNLDPFASCGGVGSIVLYDVGTGRERVLATGLRPAGTIEWSPSGASVAYLYPPPGCGATAELGVVDIATGTVTTSQVGPAAGESIGPDTWQLRWSGESVSAIPATQFSDDGSGNATQSLDVPSHAGAAVARWVFESKPGSTDLDVAEGTTTPVDLGPGGPPVWAPDDSAIAFIEPSDPRDLDPDLVPHHLVIASAGGWRRQVVGDVSWPGSAAPNDLPPLSWTADGGAIYWSDAGGAHVLDVATGRTALLAGVPTSCKDMAWQPVP